jgi:PAS domain-containing protein
MPTFLVDPDGRLLHYNASAERVLGRRFGESDLHTDELAEIFRTLDPDGEPLPRERLPIVRALEDRRPAHARMRIRGLDGVERDIAATAIPLVGQSERFLGAIAFFWEVRS